MGLLCTYFDSSAPNNSFSHQKSLHTPYVFISTLNCFVNCETKQFEYKACSFIMRRGSCNVFICILLGSAPSLFFFFGGSLLTVFAWLAHTIWLCFACISHHLASSKLHLTSFGLCYTAFTVLGKYWTLCHLSPWPLLTSYNLRSCPVQESEVIFDL